MGPQRIRSAAIAARSLLAAMAVFVLAALAALPAAAQGRVALVIGNGTYETVPSLTNPLHDARDVSTALRDVGFEVFTVTDATRSGTAAALEEFGEAARRSD